MITPEPPAGSEHYREGWRHGYEQAAIDRERSADAVRVVPDTGQASEPGAHPVGGFTHDLGLVALVADQIAETYSDEYQIRPDPGDVIADVMATVRADIRDRAEDQARCGKIDECAAKALVLARLADWLEGWPSGDTVQAPDVADLRCDQCGRSTADSDGDMAAPVVYFVRQGLCHPCSRSTALPSALLGTDTTPDRLAWIDTATATAAAERQARYQETACARRPAATSGDPAQPALAYARSEVDKWLNDGDPYCILPTRTEHIPALLARLDELEGTS